MINFIIITIIIIVIIIIIIIIIVIIVEAWSKTEAITPSKCQMLNLYIYR